MVYEYVSNPSKVYMTWDVPVLFPPPKKEDQQEGFYEGIPQFLQLWSIEGNGEDIFLYVYYLVMATLKL